MKSIKRNTRLKRFIKDISLHTPFFKMLYSLVILWILFSAGVYLAESKMEATTITSFGDGLYWGVAAFSTAGIADAPQSSLAKLIGGIWIIIGSGLFFGTIVATITTYFMRPMQRPAKRIIDTIEYNLEQLDNLTIEELDLLRDTVDTLIEHVEKIKRKQTRE